MFNYQSITFRHILALLPFDSFQVWGSKAVHPHQKGKSPFEWVKVINPNNLKDMVKSDIDLTCLNTGKTLLRFKLKKSVPIRAAYRRGKTQRIAVNSCDESGQRYVQTIPSYHQDKLWLCPKLWLRDILYYQYYDGMILPFVDDVCWTEIQECPKLIVQKQKDIQYVDPNNDKQMLTKTIKWDAEFSESERVFQFYVDGNFTSHREDRIQKYIYDHYFYTQKQEFNNIWETINKNFPMKELI